MQHWNMLPKESMGSPSLAVVQIVLHKALSSGVSRSPPDSFSNQKFCDPELRNQWDCLFNFLVISVKYVDTNPKWQHLLLLSFFSECRLAHVHRQGLVPSSSPLSLHFGGSNTLK